jgi:cation transport ATPase
MSQASRSSWSVWTVTDITPVRGSLHGVADVIGLLWATSAKIRQNLFPAFV